jgi:2-keto-3-deoxy-L-rhamnonate aldolase RhmA
MGLDMSTPLSEPRVEAAVEAIVDAAADNNIAAGTVAVDRNDIQWYLDKGLRFMAVGVDAVSLSRDAEERRGWAKEWRS